MKKKATVLIASIMAFCGINTAHADEGMWTIYNLPNAVYEMMQREGFSMTYDQLYNGEDALKNAVVNFSGYCSGVVVSPDGLVFTNHHCGFEKIQQMDNVKLIGHITRPELGQMLVTRDNQEFELKAQGWTPLSEK